MRHRDTFALKISVGCRCACPSRGTVVNNSTQAESRIDTKTTNTGCATEFTRLTEATVLHNLCRDHHEITVILHYIFIWLSKIDWFGVKVQFLAKTQGRTSNIGHVSWFTCETNQRCSRRSKGLTWEGARMRRWGVLVLKWRSRGV